MTKNKDRKQQVRARMEADGVPYAEAARRVGAEKPAVPPEREREIRWQASLGRITRAEAETLIAREAAGLPAPPVGWRSVLPEMASTYRHPAGDVRVTEILDAGTDRVIAKITVPWQDPDELEAGYRADMAAGPDGNVSSWDLTRIRLGRPDLVVHQLGWETLADWTEWPDGTWRCAARRFDRRHTVRAAPLHPGQLTIGTITVWEYPGGKVIADEIVTPVNPHDHRALDAALDKLGYTVDRWEVLPGRARYGAALPGHLAERDWYRRARVRIVKETTAGAVDPQTDRTFRAGETVTMHQRGNAGREVLRDCWWDSSDIDGAHIIRAECAEIVEILQDEPPTWDEAALTAAQVTGLLGPHHPDAAAAAAAWESAGLHVSWCGIGDLAVRTPGPEYRLVGVVPGDYWKGGAFTKPYETVPAEGPGTLHLRRKLDRLPPDPVAAAVRVIDCAGLNERIGHLAADDDLIHNGVWERASDSDREETGPCEHWDYYAIWDAWNYSCHQFLASYGATWDPDPVSGEGTLTVPADKNDEWADRLWQTAIDRFDGWIGNVVSETRKGRHLAPADDIRPRSAPGAEWVRYVTPETDE